MFARLVMLSPLKALFTNREGSTAQALKHDELNLDEARIASNVEIGIDRFFIEVIVSGCSLTFLPYGVHLGFKLRVEQSVIA